MPSHPWPMIFVSNINCPHLLKTRKYLSSFMHTVKGYKRSLCPSKFGDHALGTNRSEVQPLELAGSILTKTVSTTGQLSPKLICIVYSVLLSYLKVGL